MCTVNGPICATDQSLSDPSTTSYPFWVSTAGDTFRIVSPWASPASNASGYPGEIRWGSQTILSITTYYIYVCVANGQWTRSVLSAF